ncbi:MAG: hypothetical protein JW910_20860 [Anaerolineae bacterium]|nr:hypothetical protein [Anaerolineae bacterium]
MDAPPSDDLREAARLLKAGLRADALRYAKRAIQADRHNVAAWWLAAHAASTPEEARVALRVVLKLQPDHAKAHAALARLDAAQAAASAEPEPADPTITARPTQPFPGPLKRSARKPRRWRRNFVTVLLIALSVIVLGSGGLLLISNLTGSDFATQIEEVFVGEEARATATPRGLAADTQITSQIRDDQVQTFYFEATTGTEMFVAVGFAAIANDADTSGALELIDPDGYLVERSSPDSAEFEMPSIPLLETGAFAMLQYTIDVSGLWTLRLVGREGHSSGAYVMLMDCAPRSGCTPPPSFNQPPLPPVTNP